MGLSADRRADLAVATAEALSNAAVHGNRLRPGIAGRDHGQRDSGARGHRRGEGLRPGLRLHRGLRPDRSLAPARAGRARRLPHAAARGSPRVPAAGQLRLAHGARPSARAGPPAEQPVPSSNPLDSQGLHSPLHCSRGLTGESMGTETTPRPHEEGRRDRRACSSARSSSIFESGELRRAGAPPQAAAPAVQGAGPAREPRRRAGHARGDPARGLARGDLRRLRAVAELLHPADPLRARRFRPHPALHRDAAPARLPMDRRAGGEGSAEPAVLEWRRPAAVARPGPAPRRRTRREREPRRRSRRPARRRLGSTRIAAALAALAHSAVLAFGRRAPPLTPLLPALHLPPRARSRPPASRPDGQVVLQRRLGRRAAGPLRLADRDPRVAAARRARAAGWWECRARARWPT